MCKGSLLFASIFIVVFTSCENNTKVGTENSTPLRSENTTVATDFENLVQEYEDPDREEWQNPELVLEKTGNLTGKVIADIGAGTGYFTFKLAKESEKVIAVDIDKRFLEYIESKKQNFPSEIADKVEIRLTEPNEPSLESEEVDIVFMVNTYRFLPDKVNYLRKLYTKIKEGGSIMVIDIRDGNIPFGHSKELIVSSSEIENELLASGFQDINIDEESLSYQYIIKANK